MTTGEPDAVKAARPVRRGADGKVLRATGVTRRRPTLHQTKEQPQFQKSFENDVCYRLPSPAMQRPDILTATPDTPPDIDCAAALDLLDQDPTINQMMAMLVVQVVRRMAANDCPWMSLYLDLEQGTMTPRYATPENIAQITKTTPEELLRGKWENDDEEDEDDED